jgi:hypothetical protein
MLLRRFISLTEISDLATTRKLVPLGNEIGVGQSLIPQLLELFLFLFLRPELQQLGLFSS